MIVQNENERELRKEFARAIDLGALRLSYDDNGCVYHSITKAYDSIMDSLYASFDFMIDPEEQQRLQLSIPIFALADENGIYISYLKETQEHAGYLTRVWTECIPYRIELEGITYQFSLSGTVTWEAEDGEITQIATDEMEELRKKTISEVIEKNLQSGITQHNRTAIQYGVTYQFHLPIADGALTGERSITKPSMILLFQGYAFGGSKELYECFTFSGVSLKKKNSYVITRSEDYLYYHKAECELLKEIEDGQAINVICHTPRECAENGAFPCVECIDR